MNRSQKSLLGRWGDINREVKYFSGTLAKIERDNESGTTEEGMIRLPKKPRKNTPAGLARRWRTGTFALNLLRMLICGR
jgi:hypothetical protein